MACMVLWMACACVSCHYEQGNYAPPLSPCARRRKPLISPNPRSPSGCQQAPAGAAACQKRWGNGRKPMPVPRGANPSHGMAQSPKNPVSQHIAKASEQPRSGDEASGNGALPVFIHSLTRPQARPSPGEGWGGDRKSPPQRRAPSAPPLRIPPKQGMIEGTLPRRRLP